MQFVLSDDQALLVDGVREVLRAESTPAKVRDCWEAGRFDAARWKALAELGVVGLTVAEEHGGLGLQLRDLAPLLVEAGRVALPEPLLEVTAVATGVLTDLGGDLAATWLPRIVSGDAIVIAALGAVDPYPAHVAEADLVLVVDEDQTVAAAPDQLTVVPQPNVDPGRPTAGVTDVTGTVVADGDTARMIARRALARGATAAAAMQVGLGHAVIDLAVQYAKEREQFGQPIGAFQAVKHRLATALVDVQFARPLVERAAWSVDTDDPDADVHAAMAKAFADDAADAAVKHSLQVHGAMGYTWECDLQLWMKRSWSLAAAFGATEDHWQHLDRALA